MRKMGNELNGFFADWFTALEEGLDKLSTEECSRLFSGCARRCSKDALKYLYRGLFDECEGDLDKFFTRVHERKNVDGKVIEPGKVYELIFTSCDCPLRTDARITSPRLCACSKESMICVFKDLVPNRKFELEQMTTILGGSDKCSYRITFE